VKSEWIRSRGQSILTLVIMAIFALAMPFLLVGPFLKPWPTPRPWAAAWLPLFAVVWGLLSLAMIFFGVKAALGGIQALEDGVRIRNPFSTKFVPWADIERFSLGRAGYFPYVGRLHHVDGRIMAIWAIQAPNIAPDNRWTGGLIERLNQALSDHTSHLPPPPWTEPPPPNPLHEGSLR
jgi:hypothetical protein